MRPLMNLQQHWLFIVLFVLAGCQSAWGYHHSSPVLYDEQQDQRIVALAREELPHYGILKQGPDGYVYLKVTDRYVYHLFPLLKSDQGFIMPYAIRRHSKIGAHITVFYSDEGHSIGPIKEIGQEYSFQIEGIKRVRSGSKKFIVLDVNAPELEQLREHYGFAPKVMGHEFHITLAEKRI